MLILNLEQLSGIQIKIMRISLLIGLLYFFCACNQSNKETIKMYYNLYDNHGLIKRNAVSLEYNKNDGIKFVSISEDSAHLQYREKIDIDGIYRSQLDSSFQMTHSFTKGAKVESNIGTVYPMLINYWTTLIDEYKLPINGTDTLGILFYDEVIPFYSFTSSYYLKSENIFLIYYDQQRNTYLKISKVDGIKNGDKILRIADRLANDTTFFGKHYKLPKVELPPLK